MQSDKTTNCFTKCPDSFRSNLIYLPPRCTCHGLELVTVILWIEMLKYYYSSTQQPQASFSSTNTELELIRQHVKSCGNYMVQDLACVIFIIRIRTLTVIQQLMQLVWYVWGIQGDPLGMEIRVCICSCMKICQFN